MTEALGIRTGTMCSLAFDRVIAQKILFHACGLNNEHIFKVVVPPETIRIGWSDNQLDVYLSWEGIVNLRLIQSSLDTQEHDDSSA